MLGREPRIDESERLNQLVCVTLTDEEIVDATGIALARLLSYKELYDDNDSSQYIDDIGDNGADNIYALGTLGEYAFGKAIGEDINRQFTKSGDSGSDFTINGKRIEVKTTTRLRPNLLVRNDRVEKGYYSDVDYFVQMFTRNYVDFYICGFATYEEVVEVDPKRKPNYVLNHVVKWTDLHTEAL